MTVPDKIYLQPSAIDNLSSQNIVYTKQLSDTSIAYLRKDALLEWAEKQIEVYDAHLKDHYDTAWWHEKYAFEQVIDKLNSM